MKRNKKIQFILQRPLKDLKANLIQTLNMCFAMSECGQKVKLLLPTELNEEDSLIKIKSVIPNYKEFFEIELVAYKPKFRLFDELDRFLILKKHLDFTSDYFFTRSPLLAIFLSLKGFSTIYESHNSYFLKQRHLNKIFVIFFNFISKMKSFKLFISISENLNNFWISRGIPHSKTIGLHDGTSLSSSTILNQIEMPFKNSNLVVTYTGSLYWDRGLDRILQLAKDFENLNFLVVGGPITNAEKLKKQCILDSINNIYFLGPIPHFKVASILNKSDILLALWSKKVPTINYCSPLKVFEYMASNKLIVADAFVTIKEVLTDKKNALLVKPDDYDDLKSTFKKILSNKNTMLKLGMGNRDLIVSNYTWKKRCKQILNNLK